MWPFHTHKYKVKFRELLKNLGNPSFRDERWPSLNEYTTYPNRPLIIEVCSCGHERSYMLNQTHKTEVQAEWANTLMILKSEGKL